MKEISKFSEKLNEDTFSIFYLFYLLEIYQHQHKFVGLLNQLDRKAIFQSFLSKWPKAPYYPTHQGF